MRHPLENSGFNPILKLLIKSPHNPKIKELVRLRNERHRKKQGKILIDGLREIQQALRGNFRFAEIYFDASVANSFAIDTIREIEQTSAASVFEVEPDLFPKISFGDRNEGLVAVALAPSRSLDELPRKDSSFFVVLDGIEKPGNVGAVFRTAAAAGVDAILLTNVACHPFNPNSIRASLGTAFTVPFVVATQAEVVRFLSDRNIKTVVTRVDAAQPYTAADYRQPVAIVLGSEATGVASSWKSSEAVVIPMDPRIDSLNISATAAILTFEVVRQRGLSGSEPTLPIEGH